MRSLVASVFGANFMEPPTPNTAPPPTPSKPQAANFQASPTLDPGPSAASSPGKAPALGPTAGPQARDALEEAVRATKSATPIVVVQPPGGGGGCAGGGVLARLTHMAAARRRKLLHMVMSPGQVQAQGGAGPPSPTPPSLADDPSAVNALLRPCAAHSFHGTAQGRGFVGV